MKRVMKSIIAVFMVMLLSFTMVGCKERERGVAGECNTPGCENIQVIHRDRVQDYCFNCRDPR